MNIPLELQIGRGNSLKTAILLFHKFHGTKKDTVFLEIGTSRGKFGGGPEGDGWSTILFGWYAKTFNNSRIYTIDIDKWCIEECKKLTTEYSDKISYIVNDASQFLKTFEKQIHFLYLDGSDDPDEMYDQFKIVYDKNLLSDNCILLLDDIPEKYIEFGKGRVLIPKLFEMRNVKFQYHDITPKVNQMCFIIEKL